MLHYFCFYNQPNSDMNYRIFSLMCVHNISACIYIYTHKHTHRGTLVCSLIWKSSVQSVQIWTRVKSWSSTCIKVTHPRGDLAWSCFHSVPPVLPYSWTENVLLIWLNVLYQIWVKASLKLYGDGGNTNSNNIYVKIYSKKVLVTIFILKNIF